MENWEKDAAGNLVVCPMTGFAIAHFPMNGLLRVTFARSDAQLLGGQHESLALVLNAAQCREVGLALLRTADRIERQNPGTQQ